MVKHTGFHEYKDGIRFNPDCPACRDHTDQEYPLGTEAIRDGQRFYYAKSGYSLEELAKIRDQARDDLELLLSLPGIPKRIV